MEDDGNLYTHCHVVGFIGTRPHIGSLLKYPRTKFHRLFNVIMLTVMFFSVML